MLAVGILLAGSGVAPAVVLVVNDGGSTIRIDTDDDEDGFEDWEVNGVDHIFESFFYLRYGAAGSVLGPEDSLVDVLSLSSSGVSGNTASLSYSDGSLQVDLDYTLSHLGFGASVVVTDITLTNVSGVNLDVVWFNNPDFDLTGNSSNDTAMLVGPQTISQTDGTTTVSLTSTLTPVAWQIDSPGGVQNPLDDAGTLTNLPSATSPFGPADAAFSFQYEFLDLLPGESRSYQETYSLVPEPGATALLALAGLGALVRRRR